METAAKGDFAGVKMALLSGEDVESLDHTHCTPLFAAAVHNHFDVVELLIKAGANVNCRDKNVRRRRGWHCSRGVVFVNIVLLYSQAVGAAGICCIHLARWICVCV